MLLMDTVGEVDLVELFFRAKKIFRFYVALLSAKSHFFNSQGAEKNIIETFFIETEL